MKLGIVLPSFIYNQTRRELADAAFRSMALTEETVKFGKPTLLLLVRNQEDYVPYLQNLQWHFDVTIRKDTGLNGTEQTLAFGTQHLIDEYKVDYVTWMGDDALFNPHWIHRLAELIDAKSEARCWSVYRSAYEWVHRTLDDSDDRFVRVRSICGHGFTITKDEWKDWGVNWEQGAWCAPDGDTLDLVHVTERPGERWVTRQSWVQHTGKIGMHCTVDIPEYARDFQQ